MLVINQLIEYIQCPSVYHLLLTITIPTIINIPYNCSLIMSREDPACHAEIGVKKGEKSTVDCALSKKLSNFSIFYK